MRRLLFPLLLTMVVGCSMEPARPESTTADAPLEEIGYMPLDTANAVTLDRDTRNCLEAYYIDRAGDTALGLSVREAERVVRDIGSRIGQTSLPTVIPCEYIEKALAIYVPDNFSGADGVVISGGEYILYQPSWLRETGIGASRGEAVALFGHELGHLINRDFTARRNLPRIRRETDADYFAGCAMARMELPLDGATSLLSRLRTDQATGSYPSRTESTDAARRGFQACSGNQATQNRGRIGVITANCGHYFATFARLSSGQFREVSSVGPNMAETGPQYTFDVVVDTLDRVELYDPSRQTGILYERSEPRLKLRVASPTFQEWCAVTNVVTH